MSFRKLFTKGSPFVGFIIKEHSAVKQFLSIFSKKDVLSSISQKFKVKLRNNGRSSNIFVGSINRFRNQKFSLFMVGGSGISKNNKLFEINIMQNIGKRHYNRPYFNTGVQRFSQSTSIATYVESMNSNNLLWSFIVANVLIFILWNTYGSSPQGRKFMMNNFLASYQNLSQGRVWTILTSNFSQSEFFHLLFNMICLYYLGNPMIQVLGNARFIMVYLFGGISSSGLNILYENYLRPRIVKGQSKYRFRENPAHGASGSIMSLTMLFGLTFPREIIWMNFFIPVPGFLFFRIYKLMK